MLLALALVVAGAYVGVWRGWAGPTGPTRTKTLTVSYTEYEWWLTRWSDNKVVCSVPVDHEGVPTPQEVFDACGKDTYDDWIDTQACTALETDEAVSTCEGFYFQLVATRAKERKIVVDLPLPTAWISPVDCEPVPPGYLCDALPEILLTAHEPLPNESILAIRGTFDDLAFRCEGSQCRLQLHATDEQGAPLFFWADSSAGDTSPLFEAQVRVIPAPSDEIGLGKWRLDVLSAQWRGGELASCALLWQAFPSAQGLPAWLQTPEKPGQLISREPYAFLAGSLISHGLVPEAAECPSFGILPNGAATPCGLERARPLLDDWQNRFNAKIMAVARETGVPAQLMKNLFAHESQFWPGGFAGMDETGLGQMTEQGTDMALLWNPSFFAGFCPLVLEKGVCEQGYGQLEEEEQAMLRGAVFRRVDPSCEDCAFGIDLSKADYSISVFAETLLASCGQVGQIVGTISDAAPGEVASYEDLWRMTLANYNAGPGCLQSAIRKAWKKDQPLTWEMVADALEPACQGAIPYVRNIARE